MTESREEPQHPSKRPTGSSLSIATGDESDPAVITQHREEMERLQQALSELDPLDRRIFELQAAGLKIPAIAEELGVTEAAAQHRWQNLFRSLRAKLAGPG